MNKKAGELSLDDDALLREITAVLMPLTEQSPLKEELARFKAVTVELDENGVVVVHAGDKSASWEVKRLLWHLAEQFPLSETLECRERVVISVDEEGRPIVGYEETESLTERPGLFKVGRHEH